MERMTKMVQGFGWQLNADVHINVKGDCAAYNRAMQRLAEYENLEEQGLLLRLPCELGSTVYNIYNTPKREPTISQAKCSLSFYANNQSQFGVTIFTTKEEAEKQLKEFER